MRTISIRISLIICTVIFLSTGAAAQDSTVNSLFDDYFKKMEAQSQSLTGKPFIPIEEIKNKKELLLKRMSGKVVLVNFWFAGCKPCIMEFDALNELNKKLADNKSFELLALTFETPEVIDSIKRRYHLNYTLLSIPQNECERLMRNFGYPTNVIVDRKGTVKYWHSGGTATKTESDAFVADSLYHRILKEL